MANLLLSAYFHSMKLTVVHGMLLLCIIDTAMTVPLVNSSSTEYQSGRTVNYDKIKTKLILSCNPYDIDADMRHSISSECFDKTIGANVLLRIDFHTIKRTVDHIRKLILNQSMFFHPL